ncbi:large conductance mechanosensitive channel protein MscL [Candidatus Micrarchaeota archaeon]|nr:large conductance mechanosensitive channel protein MscL [Candidatus Micrarchaeota archaeon]
MKMVSEFRKFLREYRVLGLAVAFIMGIASNDLVESFVDNMIMPIASPLLPGKSWESAKWVLGPFELGLGPFIAAVIQFCIIAFVVFLVVSNIRKIEKRKAG